MATLKAKARNALAAAKFALPAARKYPIDTPDRAANAKSRAAQQVQAGNLSPSQKTTIDRKANNVLGKSKR